MALKNCPECNNEVSDKAAACPKCGAPVEKPKQEEKTSPPPRQEQKVYTPPPQPSEEKRSSYRNIWIGICLGIVIIAFIIIRNNPNTIPGIKIQINTPKPMIATQRADDVDASVFNFKETVYATISNQGGDGNVIVNFHLTQAGKTFSKTMQLYMTAGQNLDVKQVFDEVTRLGGKMIYGVDANAQ